jgi:hypothetical protein
MYHAEWYIAVLDFFAGTSLVSATRRIAGCCVSSVHASKPGGLIQTQDTD